MWAGSGRRRRTCLRMKRQKSQESSYERAEPCSTSSFTPYPQQQHRACHAVWTLYPASEWISSTKGFPGESDHSFPISPLAREMVSPFHSFCGHSIQKLFPAFLSKGSLIPFRMLHDTSSLFPAACHKQNRKKRLPKNKACMWPFKWPRCLMNQLWMGAGMQAQLWPSPVFRKHKVHNEEGPLGLHTIDTLAQVTLCCRGLPSALLDVWQNPWLQPIRCQ